MEYLQLTDGPDGLSRFSDLSIELRDNDFAPPAPTMLSSQAEACSTYAISFFQQVGAEHSTPLRVDKWRSACRVASGLRQVTAKFGSSVPGRSGEWKMCQVMDTRPRSSVTKMSNLQSYSSDIALRQRVGTGASPR